MNLFKPLQQSGKYLHHLHRFGALVVLTLASFATAQAATPITVLSEEFDNVSNLMGWQQMNASNPIGLSWFQGNSRIFPAHAGAPGAYVAANYLSARNGIGSIDNWLITPEVTLQGPSTLSFFARADAVPGFSDTLEVRFGTAGNFDTLLTTLGGSALQGDWQPITAKLDFTGTGRFAFRYVGDAATSNYIGLDSVLVATVPEPSEWLMLVAGSVLLAGLRRKPHA
ncbi:MAG: choice-of-anchor J domain-containing protein [Gammaproteobacteria bacterium]